MSALPFRDSFLEFDTGSELRGAACRNLKDAARAGIAPVPRLALVHGKCSEADQRHAAAFLQRACHGIDDGVDGPTRRGLADTVSGCNLLDQVCLVHTRSSPAVIL